MASKDISSFFTKPAKPATPAKRTVDTGPKSSSNSKDEVKQPASSPLSTTSSTKKSGLSEAMRKAIAEGAEEGERDAKRAKMEKASECTILENRFCSELIPEPTASLFTKTAAAAAVPAKLDLPIAKTREDLIKSLEEHPGKKELLQLELDTLGEDWLLALQDELTKPYFVSVSPLLASPR